MKMVLDSTNWGGIVAEGLPIGGGLVAGQVGTGAVGTVAVVAEGRSIESGVVATSALGTVLAGAGAIVTETGMVGSIGLGDESVVGTALVTPSGVSSTVSISGYSATTIAKTVTVQYVGGANKYFIDGVQQQTQELYERNTYRFDQSDSSNSGHPLRFSTTSNGSHGGGSEYTTGVTVNGTPGQAGAYTEITVPEFAPTLYYYCTNHSGMGGTANTPFVYNILSTTGAPVTRCPCYDFGSWNSNDRTHINNIANGGFWNFCIRHYRHTSILCVNINRSYRHWVYWRRKRMG